MKRIFLTCLVALSIFAADAQTKKTGKKSTKTHMSSRESKAKAEFAKKQQERQENIEAQRVELLAADSARRSNDHIADSSFASTQMAWKDSMNRRMDTTYTNRYKTIKTQTEDWAVADHKKDEINKAAKLTVTQGRQVKNINQSYTEKANMVKENTTLTEEQKKAQLMTLNTERLARIKAVVGNGKAKRLEKERKEFVMKNGSVSEEMWIDEVEGYAKNN